MNDMARTGRISAATLNTYSDRIRGDVIRRGKKEESLREILGGIINRYGSQLTWNALSRDMSVEHPATVADYALLLSSMGAVLILPAVLQNL